ncbi:MAG TPA: enoyl-CoA hydratase/isomerase family protein [Gammaproteobacteria bacterium]|jgi:enoyl-CoA hydratase/carnithine racemase|nr:enoyl-CoA hydratase/isomerase family protein [Gammaproteobacteria bacterium]
MSDVLFEEVVGNGGNLGVITLNRPKALNALNHMMILSLSEKLEQWEKNPSIKAIVLQACPGRAFCAGGDVRAVYEKKIKNDSNLIQFFKDEYDLNRRIFHYPKPYISYLNGITMGGGAGISIHGSHRVGTENLIFAMPETSIGFFPDIGSSYFLARLPHAMGLYMGLTGEKISAGDCAELGITTQMISPDRFAELTNKLAETQLPDNAAVTTCIDAFSIPKLPAGLFQYQKEISENFQKKSVEEIIKSLKSTDNSWCQKTAEIMETKSPTSLKVTFQELQQARVLNFDECMKMEFGIMQQFLHSHDFFEGIRALLIDKDRKPKWQPSTLETVLPENLAAFFPKIQ